MDFKCQTHGDSEYENAGQLSKWFFLWMVRLFRLGRKRDLQMTDLTRCCKSDEPEIVTGKLEREWAKELAKSQVPGSRHKPSLWWSIIRAFGLQYGKACVLTTIGKVLELAQPFLIGVIIMSLQSQAVGNEYDDRVTWAAVVFIVSSFCTAATRHRANIMAIQVGNNIRSAITSMVLKKILRMSTSSLDETDVGKVMNILANDLNRIEELSWFLAFMPITPVMVAFVIGFTAVYMGLAALGGLVVLLLFLLYQIQMSKWFSRFRTRTAIVTDQRVKLMSELISSISVVKVYCWERLFGSRIEEIRANEIHHLRDTYILRGVNSALFFIATRLMVFTSYIIHVLTGHTLNSYITFVTLSLYDSIKIPVTGFIPASLSAGAEADAGIKRIVALLLMEERQEKRNDKTRSAEFSNGMKSLEISSDSTRANGSIHVDRMCGRWTSKVLHDNLSDVSLNIEPGELIIVIGSVGSGKSCLLHALLHEIEVTSGTIEVVGDTAYAPQQPWIFGGSLRQNVLLGAEFDEERYNRVIEASCLARDIKLLPDGDQTYVGEKGYSLSGGQKARVNLARSFYRDASIYLLDDPLSAVDPKVANSIVQKGIKRFLKGKTTILVTHQLQFLSAADRVLMLDDGKVKSFMSYSEMREKGVDFGLVAKKSSSTHKESVKRRTSSMSSLRLNRTKSGSSSLITLTESGSGADDFADEFDELDEEPGKPKTGEAEEQRTSGATSGRVYGKYFTIGGVPYLMFSIITSLGAQCIYQFNDLWLSAWTGDQELVAFSQEMNVTTNETITSGAIAAGLVFSDQSTNIIFYCSMTLVLFIMGCFRSYFLFALCLRSSISLHNVVFARLLRAPISFYQNNSIGRILNRITRDVGLVDQSLPNTIMEVISTGLVIVGVIAMSVIKQPWLLLGVFVLGCIAVPIRNLYIQTARDLQRLDSLARSPVYSHVSTSMTGLVTLRSFSLQNRMEVTFNEILIDSISGRFHVMCASRFVGLYLDLVAVVYITLVTTAIVIMGSASNFSPADAGLILSSSLQLVGFFQFAIRTSAEFETQMISTERVLEYAEIESESQLQLPDVDSKHQNWPQKGDVVFDKVNMSYSDNTPLVLKDVSFAINAKEKIGIVGRTGAGKSSLITVLFRLNEINQDKSGKKLGAILIDGLDVSILGLHHLRSRISIIPQDPILFSGTIRSNLDPFDVYSDQDIWNVLELSNLKASVIAMEGQLQAPVTEGGSNLSAGQKQLLCLARALLKRNKILVCDEATANVDKATDEIIQYTIKNKFEDCTVLTIAHRLNTIIDMDRVLVLDAGQVVEYGPPYELLTQKDSGHFAQMVQQTGPEHRDRLLALAEKAYKRKHNQS